MVTVACVKWGTMYGPEYVNTLFDMVRRNLPVGFPGRFVCFTDDPAGLDESIQTRELPSGLTGWWNKLWLFSKAAFEPGERVLYFDLDTVVCGPLDAIAAYSGPFAILRDAYRPDGLQSSLMAWEAGTVPVWAAWHRAGCPIDERGDQGFVEDYWIAHGQRMPYRLQDLFPGRFRSFKVDCRVEVPRGTSVVFFHGHPRPHEVTDGWVPHVWKIGGGSGLEFVVQANVDDETLARNVRWAKEHCRNWLKAMPAHNGQALICAGGPSLKSEVWRIRGMQMAGAKIFACNYVARFLKSQAIVPDSQVILDARWENAGFLINDAIPAYIASQCDHLVFDGADVHGVGFHAMQTSYAHLTADSDLLIGGGSTVGLKAISIAYALGYRTFRLFGFDSSYDDVGNHHAYEQRLNDGERVMEFIAGERKFQCAPWMVTQAEEFKDLVPALVQEGCTIAVYGDGLIPEIAKSLQVPMLPVDVRAQEILRRIKHIQNPIGVEVGVFSGEMSVRLLSRPDLTLFMFDSWGEDQTDEYRESGDFHSKLSKEAHRKLHEDTIVRTAFADNRAHVIQSTSLDAAECMRNDFYDFVFLDADHTYDAVLADIAAWWPKVKVGGWLCGHDYDHPGYPQWGVKRAVDAQFPNRELGENYTWFVRKVK